MTRNLRQLPPPFPAPLRITKAQPMTFKRGASLEQALATILRSVRRHLIDNQPAAEDGQDPEGLHQFRVALRRLQSAMELMRALAPSSQLDALRQDADWLQSRLGEARDWDVFVTQTLPQVAQAYPQIEGFAILSMAAEAHRLRAHDKAQTALAASQAGRFQRALGRWVGKSRWRNDAPPKALQRLSRPGRDFAVKRLARLHRQTLKLGRRFNRQSPEQRHKLRITLKKLHYATDFFLPVLGKPKRNRRYVQSLAALQERLGHWNDIVTAERLVQALAASDIPGPALQATGALLVWQADHRSAGDAKLLKAWRKFKTTRPV